jgi:hypothetical protein
MLMQVGDFTVPVSIDGITVLAGLLAILALAGILSGVVALLRGRRLGLFRIGGGLVLLLIGLVAFAVAGWAQTYRALSKAELVAYIRAVPVSGQSQTMSVTYTPVHNGNPGAAQTYIVHGDQWELGGDIIKWQDYVNILGVHTGYRITRLDGYYNDASDYYNHKPLTFLDLGGHRDAVEQFLHDHANLMPFVRATYHNSVATPPDVNATYKVFLSTSGFWSTKGS